MAESNALLAQALREQHSRLRPVLYAAQAAARRSLVSGYGAGALQLAVLDLRRELTLHLDHEDARLIPALRGLDQWGPARSELLAAEHTHQRAALSALGEPIPGGSVLGWRVLTLCDEILEDMEFEERELLPPLG